MYASAPNTRPLLRGVLYGLLTLGLIFASPPAAGQQIRGTLSNFDAHNEQGEEMTNLELDLRNILTSDILDFYRGSNAWGVPPIIRDISGTEVVWADFQNPILPGAMQHFGLEVRPDAPFPCGVQAYWTRHLKIVEIPVPWQTWEPIPGQPPFDPPRIIDIIRLNGEFPEPVVITRQFATGPALPLQDLIWDFPFPGDWSPPVAGDPSVLAPGDTLELPIVLDPGVEGVFVRYTVALASDPDTVVTRFVNEAQLFWPTMNDPVITGSLSNFDVHNDTGKPVHDLELDIVNIRPDDIVGWYDGWGLRPNPLPPPPLAPVIRPLPPLPTGQPVTEVTWIDEWDPIPYCETRHFGLSLAPGTPEPLVRAFWTRPVKVWQIPVPWQWWEDRPGNVIADVIQLSDTFDEPVNVLREWAVVPFTIELDLLTWDETAGLPWQDATLIRLEPGDQTEVDIPLPPTPADTQGVFVRYTVARDGNLEETRFINEAIVAGASRQQIIGTLSNFDVVNLSPWEVTNFELDMRLIQPSDIIGWYGQAGLAQDAWGLHWNNNNPIINALPQTEVTWVDFLNPLPHCETRHFGLELQPDAPPPCGVQAYWTQHRKIAEIPVPWQTWEPDPQDPGGAVIDIVRLAAEYAEPVWIQRERAWLPDPLPLDLLNWDTPGIPWEPVDPLPFELPPGGEAFVSVPIDPADPDEQGALVRYTVALDRDGDLVPDDVITRFVNEARVLTGGPTEQLPEIVGELSNFDAHNNTGKPVHDLELDILQIAPEDIVGWYQGPDAWGLVPDPDGSGHLTPVIRPIPGGTEVTWIDDDDPIPHCETRHFGVEIRPGAPEPLVRAHWTRQVKVAQIPVPWQFWLVPGPNRIRDVIQLSDTYPDFDPAGPAVRVWRQWAVTDNLVPLDALNWDLDAGWQPASPEPVDLDPGFHTNLDIPVDPDVDAAVLVRYEVQDLATDSIVTRFVNEAMLGPGVVSGLHFSDRGTMEWRRSPLLGVVYDVVWGTVSGMTTAGGVFNASCLADNQPSHVYPDPTPDPPDGEGYYYVVRAETPDGTHGSYDTTTGPAREGRDGQIPPPPTDCP